MNTASTREYRSQLREEQAEATARRIVEAAIRVLERGPAELSIPAVAREARVSVPTVYRHYGSKADLIAAVSAHLDRSLGDAPPVVNSAEGLVAHIRATSPKLTGRHALMAPALRTPEGIEFRRRQLAERGAMVRRALGPVASRLSPGEAQNLFSIATVLCTSETLGLLEEYLGLSSEEAGAAVAWAIEQLTKEHHT